MSVNLTLRLFNGDILNYNANTITDPKDGIGKVKFTDHFDSIKKLVLSHLGISTSEYIKFIHPNEEDELLSVYLKKYYTDKTFQVQVSLSNLYNTDNNDNDGQENFFGGLASHFNVVENVSENVAENEDLLSYMSGDNDNEDNEDSKQDEEVNIDPLRPLFYSFLSQIIPKDESKNKNIDYVKKKLADKTSFLYFLTHSEYLKDKVYTEDITIDVLVDDSVRKDMSESLDLLKNRYINMPQNDCVMM